MRLSTIARMALLALALALVSGLAPVAFLWRATHDGAIETLRRDTLEGADSFEAILRRDGPAALRAAVEAAGEPGDSSRIAELVDARGLRIAGQGPQRFVPVLATSGFRIETVGADPAWTVREAGFVVRRAGDGWLVSGRLLDDWEAAQRTIERALILSTLLSLVLGIGSGLVLARYVTRRIDGLARTADAVAAGDLARRVAVASGSGDAFDRLGGGVNAMLDRIERLVAELRLMTDSVAHDLRSPIARLRARAEAAIDAPDAATRDAALGGLVTETEIVTHMLTVLLEISRSEAAGRSGFTAVAPGELIAGVADLYEPLADEAGVALSTAIEAEVAALPLHRELLSQAIANLIDNALRHAAGGGEIVLRLAATPEAIRLSVADRGPGIAPEDHEQARRRFGRLDRARSLPGAGLGLALVDAVARLHDGRLELGDNAPGLIATIVLPRPA